MTYSEFLQSLGPGFSLFFDTWDKVQRVLMTNYIFITLLGLTIFVSLWYLVLGLIDDSLESRSRNKSNKDDFTFNRDYPDPQLANSSELKK